MKKIWKDENGLPMPVSRIHKSEKLKEKVCDNLLKKAKKTNALLSALKAEITESAEAVYDAVLAENDAQRPDNFKGNYTFYNFDRTIKIESAAQDRIEFDDALIDVAKQHFDTFLDNGSTGVDGLVRELILDAFNTSKGKLDTKKVLTLVKYRQRVDISKYPEFHKAIDALEKSMSRPTSKLYHRIYEKNDDGNYEPVNLNFSSI